MAGVLVGSSRVKTGAWKLWFLAGVAPVLPLLVLLSTSLSVVDGPNVRSLTGTWRAHDGPISDGAAPTLDDTSWPTLRLPGNLRLQGMQGTEAWLRRTVALDEFAPTQRYFLTFGNIRNSMVEVFINGVYVAREEALAPYQTDIMGLHGWALPKEVLRPGNNLVAVRVWWHPESPSPAVLDRRLTLGPAELVEPDFLRARAVRLFLIYGSTFLLVLVVPLLLVLRATETRQVERDRHARGASLAVGVISYNFWLSGLGLAHLPWFQIPEAAYLRLALLALVLAPWACWEYFEFYALGRLSWLGRVNRLASLVAGALALSGLPHAFEVISVYLVVPVLYVPALAAWYFARHRTVRSLAHATAAACVAVVGFGDLLGNLSLLDFASETGVAFANTAIIITAVLLSDFVEYSRQNQVLSRSLAERNEALGVALRRAQESDRLKGEFLATMSHELRTPLNAIVNVPAGLRDEFLENLVVRCDACRAELPAEPGPEARDEAWTCPACRQPASRTTVSRWQFEGDPATTFKHLALIEKSGDQLLGLVNDVLEYTHLQSGAVLNGTWATPVAGVLREVNERLGAAAAAKRVHIERSAEPSLVVAVDGRALGSIVEKLLKNAIQFSAQGGRVEVTAEARGGQALLRVRDHGVGVAPEHHALIFEAFRQVDGGSTRRHGGAGLGLAIAKGFAEAAQGRIGVESELGTGSCFWVELPLADLRSSSTSETSAEARGRGLGR